MVETEYRATNTYAGEESTGARLTLIDGDWHFEQSNMKTITLKVDTETRDALDKEADENGFESRSAYLRDIIERRGEATAVRTKYETQIDELEAELDRLRPRAEATDDLEAENEHLRERVDELETELERVKNEKRLLLEEREEKAELVRYVEQERTVEQRWREAGLWTRAKWKVLGMPTDETSA